MADFVLVHGSGQNATCWARVGRALTARGHTVAAPDLPKREPGFGLQDHAERIAEAVAGPDTVVVAHSFSGVFLPLVAAAADCGLLVFFAAVIPEPGTSVRDQFYADRSMFGPAWIEAGSRWFDATQRDGLAREFLFHDCDPETLAWALSTVEFYDTRTLVTEPSPLAAWPDVRTASIVASADRTLSPDWGRRTTRRALQVDAIEMTAGHCPHVSQPDATADLLEQLAAGNGA